MSNIEQPSITPEQNPEYPREDMNEMQLRAEVLGEKEAEERENTTQEIAKLREYVIDTTANRAMKPLSKVEGTTYVATTTTPKSNAQKIESNIKKAIVTALIPIFSIFTAEKATGKTKIDPEKDSAKKEVSAMPKKEFKVNREALSKEEMTKYKYVFDNLEDKVKQDWNDYVDYITAIGLRGSSELNKRAVSEKVLNDWIAAHPETSVRPENISRIQRALIYYEESLDQIEKDKEMQGLTAAIDAKKGDKNIHFMEGLKHTDIDNFAGSQTTMYKFPTYQKNIIQQGTIHGKVENKIDVTLVNKTPNKVVNEGFAKPTDNSTVN